MLLASCQERSGDNNFTCIIKASQAAGVKLEAPLRANGFQIGQIGQLALNPGGDLIASIEMADTFRLSRKATLELYQPTLLGEASIRVLNFSGPPYLTRRDTVVVEYSKPAFQLPDSITAGHIRAALLHLDSAIRHSANQKVKR
ncbi:hypothetical protein GCM10023185_33680 [Hymenobacter saemangeumensis]|uniref:Mce/MlaD domain-containing protein n=2 Tax=Hymenobacter saemangeumensis TaxID=1084522 RepID=A0ABP8IPF2_9BACT